MSVRYFTSSPSEALRELGCAFEEGADGTLVVSGNISLADRNLRSLPDLSSVIVKGDFNCSFNLLTSLKGAPKYVGGNFSCNNNNLASLEHSSRSVGGNFFCSNNELTSLAGAPQYVGGIFNCSQNWIVSLEYAPQRFGKLVSVLGQFEAWEEVPQDLRRTPAEKKPPVKYPRGFTL